MGKFIDLTGQTFGQLTVLGVNQKRDQNHIQWSCKCSCGKIICVRSQSIRTGATKSCGCMIKDPAYHDPRFIDLTGQSFGRLTVIGYSHQDSFRKSYWRVKCECGNERTVFGTDLRAGKTKSCGCYQKEQASKANTTHGSSHKGLWCRWQNIRARCNDENNRQYADYGGRGIKICEAWNSSDGFPAFIKDMGPQPTPLHTVERKDVNGNYEPSNCIWATATEQARNRRNTVKINYNGHDVALSEVCEHFGLSYWTAYTRIFRRKENPDAAINAMIKISKEPKPVPVWARC